MSATLKVWHRSCVGFPLPFQRSNPLRMKSNENKTIPFDAMHQLRLYIIMPVSAQRYESTIHDRALPDSYEG